MRLARKRGVSPAKGSPVGQSDTLSPLSAGTARPECVRPADEEDPRAIHAPVSGRVFELGEVDDPVFSQGMLGTGVGIASEESVALAPVSGTVVADVKTKHALLIEAQTGAKVLLHVGLDSVCLHGAGFRLHARKGDQVKAGEPVISFDRALMRERGLDDTVIVTVTNPEDFSRVDPVCGEVVSAGAVVLRTA